MLSVKKIGLEQSSTYYSKDNYYTQQLGEWYGKGKDDLELTDLTHESFQSLLRGINPSTGKTLTPSKSNKGENVPAIDFTFSAPKSLSTLYEIAEASNDKDLSIKLQKAHDNAVNSSLNLVEKNHIQTRVQKDCVRKSVKTDFLLAAKFQHDTSRDLDPQIHTHCVTMNFTKVDGKYRSLDLSTLLKKDSPVIKNIGQYYRFKLKENLEKMGIETEMKNSKEVFFELKHVDKELIDTFSNRRAAIELKAQELKKKFPNMSHNELYQKATLQSRKSKKDVDRDKVFQTNLKIANSIVDTKKLLNKFKNLNELKNDKTIDDKSINKVIKKAEKQIQKEIKTTTKKPHLITSRIKKHSTVENIAIKAASISNSKKSTISIDDIRARVEKIHKNKETTKVYQDMSSIIKRELKATKLDTQKLFSTHEKLKSINENKLIKEEVKENATRRITINDTKSLERYDRETIRTIGNDVKKSRNTLDTSRDLSTIYRRGRGESGTELERFNDDSNRPARQDRNKTGIDRVEVTREDLRNLNKFVEKKYQELQAQRSL